MAAELEIVLADGREAYRRGDLAAAERAFAHAIEQGAEEFADIHHMLGVIYHAWGLYGKARGAFETALRINPHYSEAALSLSITYNDLGHYADAQAVLARVPKVDDASGTDALTRAKIANLHAAVGDAYRSARMPSEAAIEFRRALALAPRFVDIRLRLAQVLDEAGDPAAAISELGRARADNPRYVPVLLLLGLLLHGAGDDDAAKEALRSVLDIRPGHVRAESYLRMLEPSPRSE